MTPGLKELLEGTGLKYETVVLGVDGSTNDGSGVESLNPGKVTRTKHFYIKPEAEDYLATLDPEGLRKALNLTYRPDQWKVLDEKIKESSHLRGDLSGS